MKVLMVFDQTQAGLGGKESPDLPLGGKPMAIGSCNMFETILKEHDGHVAATLWCGDGTYKSDPDGVARKMAVMVKKLNPDVVICGPCFNYPGYAMMAAGVAKCINEHTNIPAFSIMSQECDEAIEKYKNEVNILKMPKKGGTGLNQSLKAMCQLAEMKYKKQEVGTFLKEHAY